MSHKSAESLSLSLSLRADAFGQDSLAISVDCVPPRLRATTVGAAWEQYALCAPATSRDCESAGLVYHSRAKRLCETASGLSGLDLGRLPCIFVFCYCAPERLEIEMESVRPRQQMFVRICVYSFAQGVLSHYFHEIRLRILIAQS